MDLHAVQKRKDAIAEFCRRHHIRKLSVFGSVLRGEATPESDLDILVEFDKQHVPGLLRLAGMEIELSELLGQKVDLRTPEDLSRYFRDDVVQTAEIQYAEG
ncbi:MAG TPA: nucleotidyltransferase family protein [Thermodesulfobacteriota bacterium]|nr:nucleotidyltransferase family protein [Deltaproteobacteria bacterium]HNR12799.1 nucleotidyltransferase family protein [Thermodesulfobacteriota bacterium]HNU70351.1 nucleotidyltransferase family protein [Thermodesulfobacteriota bacterium]